MQDTTHGGSEELTPAGLVTVLPHVVVQRATVREEKQHRRGDMDQ